MKNITVSVPDEVYLGARRQAVEQNTSVSKLVAEFLRSLNREEELRAERARKLEEVFKIADERHQPGPAGPVNREKLYDDALR